MTKSPSEKNPKDTRAFQKLATTTYQPATSIKTARAVDTTQNSSSKAGQRKWFGWKKALVALFLLLFIPIVTLAAWNLINFSNATEKVFETGNVWGLLTPTPLESTADDRVNILLIGYSNDDQGHAGADLTDSIMILSMDKKNHSGYMLSIPRDLYVDIPGNGWGKINEAYQYGDRTGFDEPGYTNGGVGLLEHVIDDKLNVTIHYYALVNYAAVRDTVNALNGVTVNIESPDSRGLYDPNFKPSEGGPLKLPNGPNTIDGQTALKLTRARGATRGSYGFPLSDFNRTQNQQKVLSAIQDELTWKLILNPYKNGKIFSAVAENIETDVELSEIIPLYRLFNRIPNSGLHKVTLNNFDGHNLLRGYTTPSGQSALIPAAGIDNYADIQTKIDQISE